MKNQEILAYLAGVLDSDGTIGIKRNTYSVRVLKESQSPSYSERIHIRQVTREALDLFAATFGGNVGTEDPSAKRGKPLFTWGQTDQKAVNTLQALLPYLRIKKAQALNCLNLRQIKNLSKADRIRVGRGHVGAASRRPAYTGLMEQYYQTAKSLNRVGIS